MIIRIGRDVENRITVSFPYNPDYIAKIKSINGYRWHPEEKYWSLPSESGILDRLASLFEGEKLEIDPSLRIGEKIKPMSDFENLRITRRKFIVGAVAVAAGAMLPDILKPIVQASNGPHIAIIGGGIAGLTAALTLADAGMNSTVYEASETMIGGLHANREAQ